MEPMNLLVVERGADWSQWQAATQYLGEAGVVLVQQPDESGADFRARINSRIQRITARAIKAVVLLRNRRNPAAGIGNVRFLRELIASAKYGLRVFPARVRRRARARRRDEAREAAAQPPSSPPIETRSLTSNGSPSRGA